MSEVSKREPWGPFFTESDEPCFVIRVQDGEFFLHDVNAAWERSTGLRKEVIIGRPAMTHLPEAFIEVALERLRTIVRSGHPFEDEERLDFPAGSRIWRTKLCPLPAEGAVSYIVCFGRDITDEVKATQALRESDDRFRRLADNARDVIFRYRYHPLPAVCEYVSRATERLTGYAPEEYYRDPELLLRIIHPDDRAKLEHYLENPTEHPQPLRFVHKNGSVIWTESRNVLIRDDEGRVMCVEGIARDVTDRILREEEHRKLEQKLLEAQKLESLGVLAGGVAHDFNNLLTGILGRVSLLRDEIGASPSTEHVDQIEHAAVQAAGLCRQMLAYSGKGRFMVRRLDLNDLVRESLALIQASISKSAAISVKLDPELPAVSADASQLRQVLMNLVVNASEALVDGKGTISVATGCQRLSERELKQTLFTPDLPEGRYVSLEISDSGTGMGEDTRVRIFDPFYTTKFTGRGLGLPAVLGIVRGHRGAIKVESEPGRGTTLKLYFPAVEGAGERAPRPGTGAGRYRGTGTILIIDDEEIVRSVTGRILQSFGFKVVSAADGVEGLSLFRSHDDEIVAVLLDLTMPGLDGEAVFRELRAMRQNVPVLLMSGYNEQDAIPRFAGKGLAGFLQKPFTVDQLTEKLRSILPS